jgi:hypothetical protein
MIHSMETVYALQRLGAQVDVSLGTVLRPGAMEAIAGKLFHTLQQMAHTYGAELNPIDAHMVKRGEDHTRFTEAWAMYWEPKVHDLEIRGTYRDRLQLRFTSAPHTPLRIPAAPVESMVFAYQDDALLPEPSAPITLYCTGWDETARHWVYEEKP